MQFNPNTRAKKYQRNKELERKIHIFKFIASFVKVIKNMYQLLTLH